VKSQVVKLFLVADLFSLRGAAGVTNLGQVRRQLHFSLNLQQQLGNLSFFITDYWFTSQVCSEIEHGNKQSLNVELLKLLIRARVKRSWKILLCL
jgi:hypothetical protein